MIYDCIVIGAGASGLFFSATMERRVNGLILEKTRAAGGRVVGDCPNTRIATE